MQQMRGTSNGLCREVVDRLPDLSTLHFDPGDQVVVRIDMNVPLSNLGNGGHIRLRSMVDTVQKLRRNGARVLLAGHLGSPSTQRPASIEPLIGTIENLLGAPVATISLQAEPTVPDASPGAVAVMENMAFDSGEVAGDERFAQWLCSKSSAYVNESFGTAHRQYASLVHPPSIVPAAAGLSFVAEVGRVVDFLDAMCAKTVFVVGGNKVAEKARVLARILPAGVQVLLGGYLAAHVQDLVLRGADQSFRGEVCNAIDSGRLMFPTDVIVEHNGRKRTESWSVVLENEIPAERILDIGPETIDQYSTKVVNASQLFWNGPLGLVEDHRFEYGTAAIADAVMSRTMETLIGGGDTLGWLTERSPDVPADVLSNGGGALLAALAGSKLPAVEVLLAQSRRSALV